MSPIGVGMFRSWKRQHTQFYQLAPLPRGNANPWKKVWEKLVQWGDFLTNENQSDWCGQTQSSGGRRDQLGADV
jgi:hypothetical protein